MRIVPSTASGEPTGEWIDANAVVLNTPDEINRTKTLFRKKYGMMFNMFSFLGKLRGASQITIKIDIN